MVEESKEYFYSKYIINEEKFFSRNTIQFDFKKKGITSDDIYKHIAIRIIMGIVKLPEEKFYWSRNPLYQNKILNFIMSRTHYEMLNAALPLEKEPDQVEDANAENNNNPSQNNNPNAYDSNNYANETLERVQKLINNITINFQNIYSMSQNICIDESMIAFKGKTKLKFYMPKKGT